MTVIDINQAKMIKALKKSGQMVDRKLIKFHDISDDLKDLGVEVIMSTDGSEVTEEELQSILKVLKKLRKKE